MLARFLNSHTTSDFDRELIAFDQAYGGLSTPYALCEGLEVIASNGAFEKLFDLHSTPERGVFLNRLFSDQGAIERLFAYPGDAVDFVSDCNIMLTARPWAVQTRFWLVEALDQQETSNLRHQLSIARSHDAPTGTLLPGAFNAKLQRLLSGMTNESGAGLLCNIRFSAFSNRLSGLTSEERDEFVLDFVEQLRGEFGNDCLVSRQDTLAVSLFLKIDSTGEEERHILNQVRRLGSGMIENSAHPLTVRIGAAVFPSDAQTLAHLHSCTNLTLQQAVTDGGRKSTEALAFSPDLLRHTIERETLARDMPDAITNNEITPHFQPVIEPSTGAIMSFEALIRWHHPSIGRIAPPDIITVAQDNRLLTELTAHTLRCAAEQATKWPDHVQFAVNVTPSQLNSTLVDLVRKTVRDADIDPGRIEIEVTEDALIEDFAASANIFARLRAVGVSIAMDDFGAGYTSMGNLRILDFDKIKIDKSISDGLPDDPRSVAIVRSLMFMARELHLGVTVEGIEHEDQLDFLRAFNCGVQGYVFSPPLPPSQLHELCRFMISAPEIEDDKKVLGIGPKRKDARMG